MHPVDAFLHDVDAAWGEPGGTRILLRILGSTALFLQTDYDRGTKDSDVLETRELTSVKARLLAVAGPDTDLHRRHRMYLDVVGSGIAFLAQATWHPRPVGLANFDIEVLDITDVVVTKLKRFSATDRADIEAMVDGGHVPHARLLHRVNETIAWYRFDARSNLLPAFVANFHRVERDWFGCDESRIELPDDLDR